MKTLALIVAIACTALSGCATTGKPADPTTAALTQIAVRGVIVTAVGRVVAKDNADAEVQAQRAAKIVSVATALENLGDESLASLPEITSALAPLLDKAHLLPLERQQADILVQALAALLLEQTDAQKYIATVRTVLDDVISAASYYVPADPGDPMP